MKHPTILKASVAPLALGLALVSSPAFAQDSTTDSGASSVQTPDTGTSPVAGTAAPTQGQAIIVTGSRLRQPNLESASPVTVVTSEEFANTGTTRVEDLVNSLPQVFAGQGGNISNGSSGTATLDLRNLGSERTLVLVNGRRLVPGDPNSSAADINMIPAALIKRVDVLTGGASSVYGSDAVAGVVNFIMDTDFEGFRVDGQYSLYNHDNRADSSVTGPLDSRGYGYPTGMSTNGGAVDATISFGTSLDDGRGHVTAYVGYRKINPVLQASRDYSSCALAGTLADGFSCGGSSTSPTGRFLTNLGSFQPNPDGTNTFVPGFGIYNYNPLNYYQRPDERYTAGFFANYEVTPAIKPYAEFMFMDDRTVAQIAPSGDFGNTSYVPCTNAFMSAQQRGIICNPANLVPQTDIFGNVLQDANGNDLLVTRYDANGNPYNLGTAYILRRNVEGGPRQDDLQHTSYRAVIGTKGDLSDAWSYDAYYQYGRVNFAETYLNDFSAKRLNNALDAVVDPSTGQIVCRSVLDGTDPSCAPYNVFQLGGVSQAAVKYLSTPGFQRGTTTEQVFNASLTGQLGSYGIQSPWSDEGVGINVGYEYRKESLELNTDEEFQTGDLTGQGAATLPVKGSFNVSEFFSEVRIPIVSNSWLKELSLDGGYRYSTYHNAGNSFNTNTYKIEATLAPTSDILFRASYNRAVRAPNVQDLFAPNRVALDGQTDGCTGIIADGQTPDYTAAQCAFTGVTAAQYGTIPENPAQQYNGFIGGNANLQPEVADTYSVGAVLTPRFIPNFALSVDWFKIKLNQAIQGIGADTILDTCATTGNASVCQYVHRDANGSLWLTPNGYIVDTTQNIGGVKTSGIDVNGSYSHDVGNAGKVTLTFVGTYLHDLTTDSGVGSINECAGQFGPYCGTPSPKWRHQARLGFDSRNGIGASVRWRYFSAVDFNDPDGPNGTQIGGTHEDRLAAQSYFDVVLTAQLGDHYQFRLGANNVLDKAPPLSGNVGAGFGNGNTYPQVYDALGRYIYAGVTMNF